MTDLPLSKYCDPADCDHLVDELLLVERHFTTAREQHPMRRWEYALALRALRTFRATHPYPLRVYSSYDVGGAGSPFEHMLHDPDATGIWPTVIDPDLAGGGQTLAQWVSGAFTTASVVFCLSVLEHVEDLDEFCYHLSCLTAPGGLLFLTMDAVDAAPHGDTCHFHWMRTRIFDRLSIRQIASNFVELYQFDRLGSSDWTYPGPQVYDYSFATLALVKRR